MVEVGFKKKEGRFHSAPQPRLPPRPLLTYCIIASVCCLQIQSAFSRGSPAHLRPTLSQSTGGCCREPRPPGKHAERHRCPWEVGCVWSALQRGSATGTGWPTSERGPGFLGPTRRVLDLQICCFLCMRRLFRNKLCGWSWPPFSKVFPTKQDTIDFNLAPE